MEEEVTCETRSESPWGEMSSVTRPLRGAAESVRTRGSLGGGSNAPGWMATSGRRPRFPLGEVWEEGEEVEDEEEEVEEEEGEGQESVRMSQTLRSPSRAPEENTALSAGANRAAVTEWLTSRERYLREPL